MPPRLAAITGLKMFYIPVQTRMPLKFGHETLTSTTCVRVALKVVDEQGQEAEGWGETPLSVQWVWPSGSAYAARHETLKKFCRELATTWMGFRAHGDPLQVGYYFQEHCLPQLLKTFNEREIQGPLSSKGIQACCEPMPWLAALVCNSAFDLALHDAFGQMARRPIYELYGPEFLQKDLASYLEPAVGSSVTFRGRYPADYLLKTPQRELLAWHLVGGLDPLDKAELTGTEPEDGYPVLLGDWIEQDGLKCLKVKLRGNDREWDLQRLRQVAAIGFARGAECLTADFNCTVKEFLLDRIRLVRKVIYGVTAPYASGTYLPRKAHDACEDACAGNAGLSLLYRRIYSAGRPKTSGRSSRITYRRLADYKSAIQQIQNLRYVGNTADSNLRYVGRVSLAPCFSAVHLGAGAGNRLKRFQ